MKLRDERGDWRLLLGDGQNEEPVDDRPFDVCRYFRKEMIKRAAEAEMRQLQIEKELESTRQAAAEKREEER